MYNNVKLEKGLYNLTGKSFSQALENADPSENYINTPLAKSDAYERQLKRFDIKVNGPQCDTVDKFFTTTESAVLFPEFIKRAILQGFGDSFMTDIIAVNTKTSQNQYTGFAISEPSAYNTMTPEGGTLPKTSITQDTTSTTLIKFGRLITASYEVIRQQRLDLFAVTLRSIGMKLANAISYSAVTTLISSSTAITSATNTLAYSDIVNLFGQFSYFNLNTIVASPAVVASILNMSQMNDAHSDEYGRIILPFGAYLMKSVHLNNDMILGLDKNFALEMITSSDIILESDKLIDRQLDQISVSINVGFRRIMNDAAKILNIKTSA